MKIKKETLYEFVNNMEQLSKEYIRDEYECYLGGGDDYIAFNADVDGEPIIVCSEIIYDKLCKHQLSIDRNNKIEMILKNK